MKRALFYLGLVVWFVVSVGLALRDYAGVGLPGVAAFAFIWFVNAIIVGVIVAIVVGLLMLILSLAGKG